MSGEERVFCDHLLVAAKGPLVIEDAIARWRTALDRVERAAISFSARAGASGASGATLIGAYRSSESMVRRATPWIAAAVRDLPGAEAMVRLFVLARPHAHDADELARRERGNGHA